MVKNLPAGDLGSIPRLGRSPGEGNGYPLQYSCLENPMNRGDWHATVHGVIKSQTQLNNFHYELSFLVQVMILSIGHSCTISRLCVCSDAQSCPTLCDFMEHSLPGVSVHGISQARILEWVAISSSRDLPDPGIKPASPVPPALQEGPLPAEPLEKPLYLD